MVRFSAQKACFWKMGGDDAVLAAKRLVSLDEESERCSLTPTGEAFLLRSPTTGQQVVTKRMHLSIDRMQMGELQKVQNELPAKVRGAVILVYSPTISMTSGTQQFADDSLETSSDFQEQPSAGKLSLNDAAVALAYQHAAPRSTAAEQREMTIEQLMGAFSQ